MLGTVNTARLCACRVDGDDADGGGGGEEAQRAEHAVVVGAIGTHHRTVGTCLLSHYEVGAGQSVDHACT